MVARRGLRLGRIRIRDRVGGDYPTIVTLYERGARCCHGRLCIGVGVLVGSFSSGHCCLDLLLFGDLIVCS